MGEVETRVLLFSRYRLYLFDLLRFFGSVELKATTQKKKMGLLVSCWQMQLFRLVSGLGEATFRERYATKQLRVFVYVSLFIGFS